MLDHLSLGVADLARARKFYDRALKPLGYRRVMTFADVGVGYGIGPQAPQFWLGTAKRVKPSPGSHIAFFADNRKSVRAFYRAALKAGGRDTGKPGLRPEYHPNYYGAFIIDPDGHRIEAVCHLPE
ncbi:MAG: VOC family protein [Alphaproteobacteria bacterium]|nr:VOC family protein [Alphaproteobacteria bacterium]